MDTATSRPITTKRRSIPTSGQLVSVGDLADAVHSGESWQVWWPAANVDERLDLSFHWRDASGLFGQDAFEANLSSAPSALITIARPTPDSER